MFNDIELYREYMQSVESEGAAPAAAAAYAEGAAGDGGVAQERKQRVSIAERATQLSASRGPRERVMLLKCRETVSLINKDIRDPRDHQRVPSFMSDLEGDLPLFRRIVKVVLSTSETPTAQARDIQGMTATQLRAVLSEAVVSVQSATQSATRPARADSNANRHPGGAQEGRSSSSVSASSTSKSRRAAFANRNAGRSTGKKSGTSGQFKAQTPQRQKGRGRLGQFDLARFMGKLRHKLSDASQAPALHSSVRSLKAVGLTRQDEQYRRTHLEVVFEEYDFNHDGVVSPQELELLMANISEDAHKSGARSHHARARGAESVEEEVTHDELEMAMRRLDRDKDGVLSRGEFTSSLSAELGGISRDEFDEFVTAVLKIPNRKSLIPILARAPPWKPRRKGKERSAKKGDRGSDRGGGGGGGGGGGKDGKRGQDEEVKPYKEGDEIFQPQHGQNGSGRGRNVGTLSTLNLSVNESIPEEDDSDDDDGDFDGPGRGASALREEGVSGAHLLHRLSIKGSISGSIADKLVADMGKRGEKQEQEDWVDQFFADVANEEAEGGESRRNVVVAARMRPVLQDGREDGAALDAGVSGEEGGGAAAFGDTGNDDDDMGDAGRIDVDMDANCVIVTQGVTAHKGSRRRPRPLSFAFDHCFDDDTGQEEVFDAVGMAVLRNAWLGYNASLFAYGQTGSGKSYTMTGPGGGLRRTQDDADAEGIVPRLCRRLFELAGHSISRSPSAPSAAKDSGMQVEMSYMELYNERIHDLLDPNERGKSVRSTWGSVGNTADADNLASEPNLQARESPTGGVYVAGLTKHVVASYTDLQLLLDEGNKVRVMAATAKNSQSSRSHAVCTLYVTRTEPSESEVVQRKSQISLVDLAGSECVTVHAGGDGGASGTSPPPKGVSSRQLQTTQQRRVRETSSINKSLLCLGSVIKLLAEDPNSHIPYRNSVLTMLLKPALGGNARTVMIANLSPTAMDFADTLSTLRYASHARMITQSAKVNSFRRQKYISELHKEIGKLRSALANTNEDKAALAVRMEGLAHTLKDVTTSAEKKASQTAAMGRKRRSTLAGMGIAVGLSKLKDAEMQQSTPHLVLVSKDPLQAGRIIIYLPVGTTRFGKKEAPIEQDVFLAGLGVAAEHCVVVNSSTEVRLYRPRSDASEDATLVVNDVPVADPVVLAHGDRLSIGQHHVYDYFSAGGSRTPEAVAIAQQRREAREAAAAKNAPKRQNQRAEERAASKLQDQNEKALVDVEEAGRMVRDLGFEFTYRVELGSSTVAATGNSSTPLSADGAPLPRAKAIGSASSLAVFVVCHYPAATGESKGDGGEACDGGVTGGGESKGKGEGTPGRAASSSKELGPTFFRCTSLQFHETMYRLRELYYGTDVQRRSSADGAASAVAAAAVVTEGEGASPSGVELDAADVDAVGGVTSSVKHGVTWYDFIACYVDLDLALPLNGGLDVPEERRQGMSKLVAETASQGYWLPGAVGAGASGARGALGGGAGGFGSTPGSVQTRSHQGRMGNSADGADGMIDPEDDHTEMEKKDCQVKSLIQENTRLIQLLKRASQRAHLEEKYSRVNYFSPDIETFTDMLHRDLEAIADRHLEIFDNQSRE
jgi:Ca2+-binding EF-hand superfamily protein